MGTCSWPWQATDDTTPLANGKWGAGTRLRNVRTFLKRRGQALTGHPSFVEGTLGGWIASGSHGSGGTLWRSCIGSVAILDQETGTVMPSVRAADYFGDDKTIEEQRRYIITEVELLPCDDEVCALTVRKSLGPESVHRFLHQPSYLRFLLVGARGTMVLLWSPMQDARSASTEGAAKTFRLWWNADALSIAQSSSAQDRAWFDWPVRDLDEVMTLSDANHFSTTPPFLLTSVGMMFTNFEVFLQRPQLDANALWSLCRKLESFFASKCRGRCEIRYGTTGKLFLCFVCFNPSFEPAAVFQIIAEEFGRDVPIWLHKGKTQVDPWPLRT